MLKNVYNLDSGFDGPIAGAILIIFLSFFFPFYVFETLTFHILAGQTQ